MKTMLKLLVVTAMICAVAGCVSPRATAYKSLASIAYAVDGAMKAEAAAYVAGKIPEEQHRKIAYIKDMEYNPAFATALKAAQMDWSSPAPSSLAAIAADLITLIDQFIHPKPVTP